MRNITSATRRGTVALGFSLCFALAACEARDGERGAPPQSDTSVVKSAASTSASPSMARDSVWYRRGRSVELTGDGLPDSVHLEARGARADSLQISLAIFVDGAERHRDAWWSSYELQMATAAEGATPAAQLETRLDRVLARVERVPAGAGGERLVEEDSAALRTLSAPPTHVVLLRFGYETTVRLVWDANRGFVPLWACC